MPPRSKKVLKTANGSPSNISNKKDSKKPKAVEEGKEEQKNESKVKDWSAFLESILTVKLLKTNVKLLATNSEQALVDLSVNELRRALWTPSFIAMPEGQKFLAHALPIIGFKSSYILIKKALCEVKSTRTVWENYGELIGTTWKLYHKTNDIYSKEIEDEIVKGLFHDAIMLAPPFSERFMQVLVSFKKTTSSLKARMDNTLYQSARVVLWRGCEAPNNKIRFRACNVLAEFFPWRPSDPLELEEVTAKQYSIFSKILTDTCSEIRKEGVCKILKICAKYWTYIPSFHKREYLTVICDKLVLDADVSVRVAILQGLSFMVVESICLNAAESALKCVCPLTINDKNDRVRLETVILLKKLIPNRFIKFWKIIPIDKIMYSLEVETSESVRKEIVQLVFKSFFQNNEDGQDFLKRINYLMKYGHDSALTIYRLVVPLKLLSVEEAAKHLINITLAVYKFSSGNFSDDSKLMNETSGSLAVNMDNEQNPKWHRVKLFMDCLVVLYITLLRDAKFHENDHSIIQTKKKLDNILIKLFQRMFDNFRETTALGTTMMLGSMLPQKSLAKEGLISDVLKYIREDTATDVIMPYLEATMQWNAEIVLKIIDNGLNVITKCINHTSSPSSKKSKQQKEMNPKEQLSKALYYLAYIISSVTAKQVLIKDHISELNCFYQNLRSVNGIIEARLSQSVNLPLDDDLIFEAYIMKFTIICILLNIKTKNNEINDYSSYVSDLCKDVLWFEEQVEFCLKPPLLNSSSLEEIGESAQNSDFFYNLANITLRKMCDVLMAWNFGVVPSVPKATPSSGDTDHDDSVVTDDQRMETDFIECFKRICCAFVKDTTPSEFMPSAFNASRQLFYLRPDQPELAISTLMYVPTWIVVRVDKGDELEDRQIGEQFFQLLKAVSESPKFIPKRFMHQLCQALIDALAWIIQDSSDCPDPREHNYEIPRLIEILLFQSVRRHTELFKIFLEAFGGRIMSRDLFNGAQEQHPDLPGVVVKIQVLGACAQLAHICFLNPETFHTKKRESDEQDLKHTILSRLKDIMEKLQVDDITENNADLLVAQIRVMLLC